LPINCYNGATKKGKAMPDGYAGTWMSATEAMAMLGCSSPTFYRWRANDPEFPKRNERGRYLDLDVLEYAAKMGIRAKNLR
jgi:predicted DNA-binding transcriptional regulator AlpA